MPTTPLWHRDAAASSSSLSPVADQPSAPRPDAGARRAGEEPIRRFAAALSGPGGVGTRLEQRLVVFSVAGRWIAIGVGVLLGAIRDPLDSRFITVAIALCVFALIQSLQPLQTPTPAARTRVQVVLELVLSILAVVATGGLQSPFVLVPMIGLMLAGYVFGRRAAIGTAIAGVIAAAAAVVIQRSDVGAQRSASQLAIVFLLCGALGAFARNLVVEIRIHQAAALDHAAQMATANDLLVSLHAIAQTLPASLDLGEVVDSMRLRLRSLFAFGVLVILTKEDAAGDWRVGLAEGARLPERLSNEELPAPSARALAAGQRPVVVADRLANPEGGFAPLTRSAIYVALRARGRVVGLIGLEHPAPRAYGHDEAALLASVAGPLALAVDNARWFGRLRIFGAEAERARIARELHDRIAQSLAYVAFELERLETIPGEKRTEIGALHDVVRGVVTDLRETLYQLRAGVTDDLDLEAIAPAYLRRFAERTGITVEWHADVAHRLHFQVEQELWRILQEALANVERHSGAPEVRVEWIVGEATARLSVADQGCGFSPAAVEGEHYGIVGMQERADAVGARLRLESMPGSGTRLVVELDQAPTRALAPSERL